MNSKEIIVGTFVFRHYRSGDWCPYQGVFHNVNDDRMSDALSLPDTTTSKLRDGDEVEVIVRKTGKRAKRVWELVSPHTYEPVSVPKQVGCKQCQGQ